MESLKSMQLSKKEMKEIKGARWVTGAGTEGYGDGSNGATTYMDGMNMGHDNSSGSMGGDSWSWLRAAPVQGEGVLKITKR